VAGLLDVNVLVALFVLEHQHHELALSWFEANAATDGWATCAVTELGVIRVCAQLQGGDWSPEITSDRLLLLTASSREYVWWADAVSPAVLPEVRSAAKAKHVTDRYLLGLSRRNGGQLVTFDRALAVTGGRDVICLLPSLDGTSGA
jgi:toxin-antitoxin system PIN domain toxin